MCNAWLFVGKKLANMSFFSGCGSPPAHCPGICTIKAMVIRTANGLQGLQGLGNITLQGLGNITMVLLVDDL